MASNVIRGLDIVISVNTGTSQSPTWTPVAGQRGCTLNRNGDVIDISNKVSSGWKEVLTSLKEWSIESDGIFVDGDTAITKLDDAFLASDLVHVKMAKSGDSWGFEGNAIITEFPISAPYDDAVTYTITLQGAGELKKVEVQLKESKAKK